MEPMSDGDIRPGLERLHKGGTDLAIDMDGNIYFSYRQGADLYVLRDMPTYETPESDLIIYGDGIEPGWTFNSIRGQVDANSTERVSSGTCQRVDFDGFCQLQYHSQDIWGYTPWEFKYLVFDIDPGQSKITDIILTKTGPGSTERVSIVKDQMVDLTGDGWTRVEIPISTMGWLHGSRIGSITITLLGSGTLYVDSVGLSVPESWYLFVLFTMAGAILFRK
jgi:hypothetical protein